MKINTNTYATIIFTCASLLMTKNISATTWNAATANQSDVYAAILQAADGDTVVVPSTLSLPGGMAIWTSRIDVTIGITINYWSGNIKPKYRKSDGNRGQFSEEYKSIWPTAIQPNSHSAMPGYRIHIRGRCIESSKRRWHCSSIQLRRCPELHDACGSLLFRSRLFSVYSGWGLVYGSRRPQCYAR